MARAPRPRPTPLAAGDDAAAAGFPTVPGSAMANTLETEVNITRDLVAQQAKRSGPRIDIWVQSGDPGHAPGRVWIHPA